MGLKESVRDRLPRPIMYAYRAGLRPADTRFVADFVRRPVPNTTLAERARLALALFRISDRVESPHSQEQVLTFMETILSVPPEVSGCVVEAGCFKGGSSAKFSLAAKLAGRTLHIFDSFEGLPANDEHIFGQKIGFPGGDYKGELEEVQGNIRDNGHFDVCRFHQGWLEATLPDFSEPVVAAYVDVDLQSSTRTAIEHLWPLVVPGGIIYSQDGQVPLVVELLRDESFWRDGLGVAPPLIDGLGTSQLLVIHKPAAA
jgi:O-methyltransferase